MDILSQIFGSTARVKMMRLFLFNEQSFFTNKNIASKTRLTKETISKEIRVLEKMGMISKKESSKAKKTKSKDDAPEYGMNPRFLYTDALKNVLTLNDPVAHQEITDKLKKAGKLRLVLATGVFLGKITERIDLLIVGDSLKKDELEKALVLIESDVGREVVYATFDTDDFLYRISVRDRLVRDIMDSPHEKLIDKLLEEEL